MIQSIRKKPIYRILVWIAFILCILVILYLGLTKGSVILPFGDTVSYWASGRLLLQGNNPYSPEEVLKIQDEIGELQTSPLNEISMNLYPPWTMPFTLPLGLFTYPLSRVLWLIFHIIAILVSVREIWILYGGSSRKLYIPYLMMLFFAPTIFLLGIGHNSALLLVGLVGFLYFIQKPKNNQWNYFLAGASAVLVTFKPQILSLFLVALFLWIIQYRAWHVLIGGVLAISLLTLITMVFDPQVISHYWVTFSNYKFGTWGTPTIGFYLRIIFGIGKDWLQLVPTVIGIIWLLFYWLMRKEKWNWLNEMPILMFACVFTAAYVWTYDMVVLLIPVIAVIANISRIRFNRTIGVYILSFVFLNIITFYFHLKYSDYWFVWFAPVLLIWYLIGLKLSKKDINTVRFPNPETNLTLGN